LAHRAERVLLSLFSGRTGETPERAIGAYLRLAERPGSLREITRLAGLVARMRATGVLVGAREDVSRFDVATAADYLKHRPFPAELAELIVREGQVGETSRVLDLAGGPGVLALALAATSRQVSLMELSRGFITATGREATRRGLKLKLIHDSPHRLAAHEDAYDVIALSQEGAGLDDLLVCRGVGSVLRQRGSFFVVLRGVSVRDDHPLAYLLGDKSILGRKPPGAFADRARGRMLRLSLLFAALNTGIRTAATAPRPRSFRPACSSSGRRGRSGSAMRGRSCRPAKSRPPASNPGPSGPTSTCAA